jgi:exonuclease SbcC
MFIKKILIHNIMNIVDLEIQAGQFTIIEGQNASGKTSILEAIKSVLQGGSDATLIRKGETEGEVILLLDNDIAITKTIKENGSDVKVTDKIGIRQKTPQSYINKLIDKFAVNPIDFLVADDKTRINLLFEALPSELDTTRLKQIEVPKELQTSFNKMIDSNLHPLTFFNTAHQVLYDNRTGINRAFKEKQATVSQLAIGLLEVSPAELQMRRSKIEAELNSSYKKKDDFRDGLDREEKEARAIIDKDYLRMLSEIEKKHEDNVRLLEEEFQQKTGGLKTKLAVISEQEKSLATIKANTELKNKLSSEAEKLNADANLLTKGLQELETLKAGLLDKLPIKNLEIKEGAIYLNGIPFKRVNTAEQIKCAIEVAKLKSGELKVICVDGIERLDAETFEVFKMEAEKSEIQMIITKVTNKGLTVK